MLSKEKEAVKMFFWVCLSAIIQSFALVSFSMPVNIYPSGVTGFSRIVSDVLADFFNINLPFFYLYMAINVALAILVYSRKDVYDFFAAADDTRFIFKCQTSTGPHAG